MNKSKKILKIISLFIFFICVVNGQIITSDPQYPTARDSIVIYYDATQGDSGLKGYSGDVYAHTGVTVDGERWQNVMGSWGDNNTQPQLTRIETNLYKLAIGNPYKFYNVEDSSKNISELCFVFRGADADSTGRAAGGEDIFYQLYEPGLTVVIDSPRVENRFNHPLRSPIFKEIGDSISFRISAVATGTNVDSFLVFKNDSLIVRSDSDSILYFGEKLSNSGGYVYNTVIIDSLGLRDTAGVGVVVNPVKVIESRPEGVQPGINYMDNGDVVLVLFAPYKDFVYTIGDFNDWKVTSRYFMKMDSISTDSVIYWCRIDGLSQDQYYGFQYLIDGELRIADPYTELVLDPWNDKYIEESTFPNMPEYPAGKTDELAGVIFNKSTLFNWTDSDYRPPEKEKLVIYECLLRDFVSEHNYQTLTDTLNYLKKLGINAIELMPVNEFEGNLSWGYNPSFYFAPDKFYGPPEALKQFVNTCHENGIAVIGDLVLNHSYGQSSLVRMYWNSSKYQPAANNPWYRQTHNFANPAAQWGYDFDHESKHTEYFVDRVTSYWIEEFHFDGYRFDFTKGFTNKSFPRSGDNSWGSDYDNSRIQNLKRMANQMWQTDSNAYAIFEHLAVNQEEKELADHGILLWGNLNHNYNEATMGYHGGGKSDFSWGYYGTRDWNNPHLISYMESHDEERLMFKNLKWGNSRDDGSYDITELPTALDRMELANAFFLTYPGPKMIWQFGELGYDKSIDSYGGRLAEKPSAWELGYHEEDKRLELYNTIKNLLKLRQENSVFTSKNTGVKMDVAGDIKTIKLSGPSNVIIKGNFGIHAQTVNVNFFHGGIWYDFFSGDTLDITGSRNFVYGPGEFHIYSDEKFFTPATNPVEIAKENKNNIPEEFTLSQNYPNPFNSSTVFKYTLDKESNLKIKIYDLRGRLVFSEKLGQKSPGYYQYRWTGTSKPGQDLASGIYFFVLEKESQKLIKKMAYFK